MTWSRDHEQCRGCGRTDRKHMAKGLCNPCYQTEYRNNDDNKDRIVRKKQEWYYRYHEDNLLKRKRTREQENFDGRREEVLLRDGHQCVVCGSTFNLTVHHKDRSGRGEFFHNNDLDNLETVCRSCHVDEHREELERARRVKRVPQLLACGRWSLEFDACVVCGEVYSKHMAKGMCSACYQRNNKMT